MPTECGSQSLSVFLGEMESSMKEKFILKKGSMKRCHFRWQGSMGNLDFFFSKVV